MSINEEKLQKAVELEEKYGTDPDKIMLMEPDEFKKVMGESLDIYSYEGYLQNNIMPTSSELAVFKGPTLDYVKSIIARVSSMENLNQDEISDLNNILLDLKIKFKELKETLEKDKKDDENLIMSTKDIYTKEEYRREELSYSMLLLLRCDMIINTLDQNIVRVTNRLSRTR